MVLVASERSGNAPEVIFMLPALPRMEMEEMVILTMTK